jgi:hypothetical protein
VPVLLLAVLQLVPVRAPDEPLDDDTAFGCPAEQFGDGRPVRAEALIGVAAPVGEEQLITRDEGLDLVDQLVEVGGAVHERHRQVALSPRRQPGGRVAPLAGGEKPVLGAHGAHQALWKRAAKRQCTP